MRPEVFDLSTHNTRIFFDPSLPDWYAQQSLCPAETMILLTHLDVVKGKRVLDLGVGSGRTTRFLVPLAADYLGIDISPVMLERARTLFPDVNFLSLDLRELSALRGREFDLVAAPWAVLDVLTHEERLAALRDIASLLPTGGSFIFSSHNRQSDLAGLSPPLPLTVWPDKMARNIAHFLIARVNYQRLRRQRREEADYALFNDMAHRWRGVFYYIDREAQTRQAEAAGFEVLSIVGEDGRVLKPGEPGRPDGALHYICRKTAPN